jgi:hypothetical protein
MDGLQILAIRYMAYLSTFNEYFYNLTAVADSLMEARKIAGIVIASDRRERGNPVTATLGFSGSPRLLRSLAMTIEEMRRW